MVIDEPSEPGRPVADTEVDARRERRRDRPADRHRRHREPCDDRADTDDALRVRRHVRRLPDQDRADREPGDVSGDEDAVPEDPERQDRLGDAFARSSTNATSRAAEAAKSATLVVEPHAQLTPPSSSARISSEHAAVSVAAPA